MANASLYRPKFGAIDLMTNCWVGGHILTWWQSLSSCLNKTSLLTSEFEQIVRMKVLGNCLSFPTKKKRIGAFGLLELEIWAEHWTISGLEDRFRLLRCFFFGKLTYVLKEEDTNIIRGIPQIYNDNRNIKQQMATG